MQRLSRHRSLVRQPRTGLWLACLRLSLPAKSGLCSSLSRCSMALEEAPVHHTWRLVPHVIGPQAQFPPDNTRRWQTTLRCIGLLLVQGFLELQPVLTHGAVSAVQARAAHPRKQLSALCRRAL